MRSSVSSTLFVCVLIFVCLCCVYGCTCDDRRFPTKDLPHTDPEMADWLINLYKEKVSSVPKAMASTVSLWLVMCACVQL